MAKSSSACNISREEVFGPRDAEFGQTVSEANLEMLKAREHYDVIARVGPLEQEIKCHKAILVSRSPVFKAIFSETWSTSAEAPVITEDKDTEPEVFELFLEFLYGDHFSPSFQMAMKLLAVADFYDVKPLVKKCEKLMSESLDLKDAIQVFVTARRFDLKKLMIDAAWRMASEFSQLVRDPDFKDMDEETLAYLLKRDDVCLAESELFAVVLQWARDKMDNDPGRRSLPQVLKNVLHLIRFPIMSHQEFANRVIPAQILAHDEVDRLLLYFNSNSTVRSDVAEDIRFSCIPRKLNAYFEFYDATNLHQQFNPATEKLDCVSCHEEILEVSYFASDVEWDPVPKGAQLVSVLIQGPNYDGLKKHWPLSRTPDMRHVCVIVEGRAGSDSPRPKIYFQKDCILTKEGTTVVRIDPTIRIEHEQKYRIKVRIQTPTLVIKELVQGRVEIGYDILRGSDFMPCVSDPRIGTLMVDLMRPRESKCHTCFDNPIIDGIAIRPLHIIRGIRLMEE